MWWDQVRDVLERHGYSLPFPLLELELATLTPILDFLCPDDLLRVSETSRRMLDMVEAYSEGAVNRIMEKFQTDDGFLGRVQETLRLRTSHGPRPRPCRFPHRHRYWSAVRTYLYRLGVDELPVCEAIAVLGNEKIAIAQSVDNDDTSETLVDTESEDGNPERPITISVYDLTSRKILLQVQHNEPEDMELNFGRNGRAVVFLLETQVICCSKSFIRCWSLADGELLNEFHIPITPRRVFCYSNGFVFFPVSETRGDTSVDAYDIFHDNYYPDALDFDFIGSCAVKDMFIVENRWLVAHHNSWERDSGCSEIHQFDLQGSPWTHGGEVPHRVHCHPHGTLQALVTFPRHRKGVIGFSLAYTGYTIAQIYELDWGRGWIKKSWSHLKTAECGSLEALGSCMFGCYDVFTMPSGAVERKLARPDWGDQTCMVCNNQNLFLGQTGSSAWGDDGLPVVVYCRQNTCA